MDYFYDKLPSENNKKYKKCYDCGISIVSNRIWYKLVALSGGNFEVPVCDNCHENPKGKCYACKKEMYENDGEIYKISSGTAALFCENCIKDKKHKILKDETDEIFKKEKL